MFSIHTGKYTETDWQDTVDTWGITHVPSEQYISLDFGRYFTRLDWGVKNV
jgi:hypothetical protein